LSLRVLHREIVACRACPRLVAWREEVAARKRRAYAKETYWGRPVPGFGDPSARIVLLGMAPGAHGANRTGRVFTGDRSGDFLFAALHRAGLASQADATSARDGLRLHDVFISLAVRCVPPGNLPSPNETEQCGGFLDRELALLERTRVVVALGAVAWGAFLQHWRRRGQPVPRPAPPFGHGVELELKGLPALLGSYHVSQQNTQTGKLTTAMFDGVLVRAQSIAGRVKSLTQPP
jgi:uracil-DNA glycosylase family 4